MDKMSQAAEACASPKVDADEAPNTDGVEDPNAGVDAPPAPQAVSGNVIRYHVSAMDKLDAFHRCKRKINIYIV